MRSISVAGYRDLGKNVGQSLTYAAQGFHDRGRLHRVYPRGVIETELPHSLIETPLPFGRYGPSFLWLLSNKLYEFDHRTYSMRMVDYFASRKIGTDGSEIAYFDIPGFLRSVERANAEGKQTVVRGSTELAESAHERVEAEYRRLGIEHALPESKHALARRRRRSLEEADQLIALSSFVRDSYVDAGIHPDKISVVTNAIDMEQFKPKTEYDTEKFRALFVGSIGVRKGVATLLEAWDDLNDDTAELVLCGHVASDIKPVLEKYSRSNIQLPGWVDPEPHYRDASVFVLPSLSEGFAKVILEAMSTGTPVIVSENSGGADVVEDGEQGFVIPPGDPGEIVEKLQYFRDEPGEVQRMGRNARSIAEQHSGDQFVDDVLEIIDAKTNE